MNKKILILFIFTFPAILFAQEPTPEGEISTKTAKDFYNMGDYRIAFQEYEKLVKAEPNNVDYLYTAGECILKGTFMVKGNAIPYLEQAYALEGAPLDVLLLLAEAYHLDYQFDKAIELANKLIETSEIVELKELAKKRIETIENAKVLMKKPLNVKIENLGEDVNSEYPDYYAFVHENEEYLMFSTRRDKGNGGYIMEDGYKSAEIFMVKEKRGEWHKAKAAGGVLTTIYDEEIVGMSSDGEVVFVNVDSYEISGQIQMATKKGRSFQKPELLLGDINLDESIEVTAYITDDLETIYFASNRVGGFGGYDLYYSKILPDGTWGAAVNLGPEINTQYDEYFPQLDNNGLSIYFASEGHNSMGGFDIFSSELNIETQKWKTPQNIGYPINTVDDDFHISFTNDKRRGYITSLRPGGVGNLDIYSVTFNEVDEKQSVIMGNLYVNVPIDYNDYQVFDYYEVNGETKRIIGEIKPRTSDGWNFIKTEKKTVQPGMQYRASLIMEKDGEQKTYSLDKAPLDDESFKLMDVKIVMVPIENYKPLSKTAPKTTKVIIKKAIVDVFDAKSNELVGNYILNPQNGKLIMILPVGEYKIHIDSEGYKSVDETITILGKGSFNSEISKDFELEPKGELPPIHYKFLEQN